MEAVKGLRLPTTYVEVTNNEMEYLEGGKLPWGKLGRWALTTVGAVCTGVGSGLATGMSSGNAGVGICTGIGGGVVALVACMTSLKLL